MKKFLISVLFLSGMILSGFSQNAGKSAAVANRTTAVRFLKLAENCLVGNDFQSALNNSRLGISYDESISDLYYLEAAAGFKLGETKAAVLLLLERAFELNNWLEYTKNGARILYADLLSDTGRYEESLKILDDDPFIYSADAEVIRVKNYYCMGTDDSVGIARNKVNGARRVYPADERFMKGFFYFESAYLFDAETKGRNYIIPEIVQVIADSYIQHLPDYSGKTAELELLASFFAAGEKRVRLVKAIDAKQQSVQPVLAIAGLKAGIYSQQQAVDLFFETTGNEINLKILKYLVSLISEEDVKYNFSERLTNIDCTLLVDRNFDLQNELNVKYKFGRPYSFTLDANNDGIIEVAGKCDLGAPEVLTFADNLEIDYYEYPEVSFIYSNKGKKDQVIFEFLKGNYKFAPMAYEIQSEIAKKLSVDFVVPDFPAGIVFSDNDEILQKCSKMELPVKERENGRVLYSMFEGQPVSADFYDDGKLYGTCNFRNSVPFVRYVDYDNDDTLETQEIFDIAPDDYENTENSELIAKIFSPIVGEQKLYLKKIQIDRNQNTFFDFTEEYCTNGDVISVWDNDDDGIPDCKVTVFAKLSDEPQKKEIVYFNLATGEPELSMTSLDGVPVKLLNGKGEEIIIFAGEYNDIYWIESNGGAVLENQVFEKIKNDLNSKIVQGQGFIVQCEEARVYVVEVGTTLFFRVIPEQVQVE